tara:strand:- start:370 stop:543 length:174 start_codon:yes stop_codon:yes gene_type:complete
MSNQSNSDLWATTLDEISKPFDELKKAMDKHPNAFKLFYSEEEGYGLEVNMDSLKPL